MSNEEIFNIAVDAAREMIMRLWDESNGDFDDFMSRLQSHNRDLENLRQNQSW